MCEIHAVLAFLVQPLRPVWPGMYRHGPVFINVTDYLAFKSCSGNVRARFWTHPKNADGLIMAASRKKTPARKAGSKTKAKAKTPAAKKTPARKKTVAKKKPVAKKKATASKKAPTKTKTKTGAKTVKPTAKSTTRKSPAKKSTATKSPAKKAASGSTRSQAKAKTPAAAKPKTGAQSKAANEPKATKKPLVNKATAAPAVQEEPKRRAIPLDDYMTDEHVEEFRQQLLGWKQQLMEEVDRTVTHMKDVATNDPDPADRATQEEEFTLELKTRDRERRLIKKIDSTLETLDIGDYGFCESCGIEIGLERLRARPTATQCIDCKTLAEIREKQTLG